MGSGSTFGIGSSRLSIDASTHRLPTRFSSIASVFSGDNRSSCTIIFIDVGMVLQTNIDEVIQVDTATGAVRIIPATGLVRLRSKCSLGSTLLFKSASG